MSGNDCTRARRRSAPALRAPASHAVPPRVTAKARAAFAWRIIELRLDEILAEGPQAPR